MGKELAQRKQKPSVSHSVDDKARFDKLTQMGCIVCRRAHGAFVQAEVAHMTDCGRRVGHQSSFPLCAWHHRGIGHTGIKTSDMERLYGPSFARSKKDFEAAFGTEADLVQHTNDWLGIK